MRAQDSPQIAFFDLDDTLLKGFSGFWSALHLVKTGRMTFGSIATSMRHIVAYKLQRADYGAILADGLKPWIGAHREDLAAVSRECFKAVLEPRLFRGGIQLVEAHRSRGTTVVLLSSTSPFLLEEVGRHLQCDDVIATRFVFEGDHLTDRLDGPLVFGDGKRDAADTYAKARGITLNECAFYSDSASDLPLLRVVGHPRAVNPDCVLAKESRKNGWPVIEFRRTVG